MAVAFGAVGTNGTGTTSVAPGYPTVSAGDLIILVVDTKSGTIVDPSGWTVTLPATTGGSMTIAVYTQRATGSESGSQTVNITSGTGSSGKMMTYTAAAGHLAVVGAVATDDDAVSDTAFATGSTDNFPAIVGDVLLALSAINDDQATSARAVGASGAGFGGTTNRFGFNHTAAGGLRTEGSDATFTSIFGGQPVNPTYGATIAAAVTGIAAFLMIHETQQLQYRRRTSLGLTFR